MMSVDALHQEHSDYAKSSFFDTNIFSVVEDMDEQQIQEQQNLNPNANFTSNKRFT